MSVKNFQNTVFPIKNTLFRVAKRVVGSTAEAEDVVQEVFIKIWKQRAQLPTIQNVEAWCMRMTKNLSIDKLRSKHQRTIELNSTYDQVDFSGNPHQLLESKDAMEQLQTIMNKLPEKQRLILHLRDVEGLSYQEISETMELPLNQIKVNLFRARKQMKEYILHNQAFNSLI